MRKFKVRLRSREESQAEQGESVDRKESPRRALMFWLVTLAMFLEVHGLLTTVEDIVQWIL